MTAEPGALAARMDQIRRRLSMRNYTDSAALLAALEAVLKQAADWEAERPQGLLAELSRSSLLASATWARVDAGVALREAITSKLLSEAGER